MGLVPSSVTVGAACPFCHTPDTQVAVPSRLPVICSVLLSSLSASLKQVGPLYSPWSHLAPCHCSASQMLTLASPFSPGDGPMAFPAPLPSSPGQSSHFSLSYMSVRDALLFSPPSIPVDLCTHYGLDWTPSLLGPPMLPYQSQDPARGSPSRGHSGSLFFFFFQPPQDEI